MASRESGRWQGIVCRRGEGAEENLSISEPPTCGSVQGAEWTLGESAEDIGKRWAFAQDPPSILQINVHRQDESIGTFMGFRTAGGKRSNKYVLH